MRLAWAALLSACSAESPADAPFECTNAGPGEVLSVELANGNWPKTADITFDADHIYWVNFDGRAVRRIAKTGGAAETIATPDAPLSLAVDATTIYVLEGSGVLKSTPIGGGPMSSLASATCASAYYPCGWGVAVDDQTVYWGTDHELRQMPKTAGMVVATRWPGSHTRDLVLDDDYVYVARAGFDTSFVLHATVERIPKLGGTPATLFDLADPENSAHINAFAADADHVYVSETVGGAPGTGRIWRVRKDGTEQLDLALPGSAAIAVADGYLYVSRGTSIERVSTSGGVPQTIACDSTMNAGRMAVDADRIYWIDSGRATIRSIGKPQ